MEHVNIKNDVNKKQDICFCVNQSISEMFKPEWFNQKVLIINLSHCKNEFFDDLEYKELLSLKEDNEIDNINDYKKIINDDLSVLLINTIRPIEIISISKNIHCIPYHHEFYNAFEKNYPLIDFIYNRFKEYEVIVIKYKTDNDRMKRYNYDNLFYDFKEEINDELISKNLFNITTEEFFDYALIPYFESNKEPISKKDFYYYIKENFDTFIYKVNNHRNFSEYGFIIGERFNEKVRKSIFEILNMMSDREFKLIVRIIHHESSLD